MCTGKGSGAAPLQMTNFMLISHFLTVNKIPSVHVRTSAYNTHTYIIGPALCVWSMIIVCVRPSINQFDESAKDPLSRSPHKLGSIAILSVAPTEWDKIDVLWEQWMEQNNSSIDSYRSFASFLRFSLMGGRYSIPPPHPHNITCQGSTHAVQEILSRGLY